MSLILGSDEIREEIELCMCPICEGEPHLIRQEIFAGEILNHDCIANTWTVVCEKCKAIGLYRYKFSAESAGKAWNEWARKVNKQKEKNRKHHKALFYKVEPWGTLIGNITSAEQRGD